MFGGEFFFSKVFDGFPPSEVKSPIPNFGWPRKEGGSEGGKQGKPCGRVEFVFDVFCEKL